MNFAGVWRAGAASPDRVVPPTSRHVRSIAAADATMIVLGHCMAPDAELADGLRAVRRSRRPYPGMARWPGCYSLSIFLADGIIALTDPVGQFPLYWATDADDVWLSSSATELAVRTDAGFDRVRLAASIACSDLLDSADDRTAFTGVNRLPPGHVVTIDQHGVVPEQVDTIGTVRGTTFDDAAERLRLSLLTAVEARGSEAGSLSADFSGGIDSSALVFLATRAGARISGYTSHHSADEAEDDLWWARRHATSAPGLTHHLVADTDDDLPYQQLAAHDDDPHPSPIALGPTRSRLRLAAEHGATTHLVGEGGDVMTSAPPAYLADLARNGHVTALWRHCVRWARIRQTSPLALLRRATYMATTSRPQALHALAATIERATPLRGKPPWHVNAVSHWSTPRAQWLTRQARVDLTEHVRGLAEQSPSRDIGVADAVTLSQLRTQLMTQRAVRTAGLDYGIDVHAPYLDTEVVKACLSLPAYRRADPVVPKPLLVAALTGLVPRAVLTRPTKGDYTRSFHLGVRRAAPALRALLADSAAADWGLIDPVPVRAALDGAIQGVPTSWSALNQVFAVELWLRETSRKVSGG